MELLLEIENLKYKEILENITFSLKKNTFSILIGSNGSGKTTLINCIRNLTKYDGNIRIFNQEIRNSNHEIYKKIGFFLEEKIVLENNAFEELLNMLRNLNYDEDKAKKKIYSLFKKLNATEILFKSNEELLMYEQTLISFAFSIIHSPKLLIIDNDLEELNQIYKNKIFDYIKSQKEITVLYVTNDEEMFNLADNLIFLSEGKIILTGNIDEVISQEKNFIKCGTKIPFMIDLSKKLIIYELINEVELDFEKLVNKIWD